MIDTQSVLKLIISTLYYIVLGMFTLFSLFGVYLLSSHGRSRLLSLGVSLAYIFAFLTLVGASQATLHSLF